MRRSPRGSTMESRVTAIQPDEGSRMLAQIRLAGTHARREKTFGLPARKIDRNDRVRIIVYCRALSMKLRKRGQHGGPLTHAREKVLRSLLYDFLNWADGRCFPSYETISKKAGVARSVVAEAIKVIEAFGVMRVVNRLLRVRWKERDQDGRAWERWRVMRTSNAYEFTCPISSTNNPPNYPQPDASDPHAAKSYPQSSKSGGRTGTLSKIQQPPPLDPNSELGMALERLRASLMARQKPLPA